MDVTSYILLTRRTRPNSITLILLFNVVQVSCEDGISKKVKSAYKLSGPSGRSLSLFLWRWHLIEKSPFDNLINQLLITHIFCLTVEFLLWWTLLQCGMLLKDLVVTQVESTHCALLILLLIIQYRLMYQEGTQVHFKYWRTKFHQSVSLTKVLC